MTTPLHPTVAAFVDAINSADRVAFDATLARDATMSDDGTDRDLRQWVQREIFGAGGRMTVTDVGEGGRHLLAEFTNTTYGAMRTAWTFVLSDHKIARFETGQA